MRRVTAYLAATLAFGAMAHTAQAGLIDVVTFDEDGISSDAGTPATLDGVGYGAVDRLDGTFDYVAWTHNFALTPGSTIGSGVLAILLEDDSRTDGVEIGFGIAESGQWDIGQVQSGTYSYDISINTLLDGSLSVLVASVFGDFFIRSSTLTIEYKSVPEPATLSLLGIGVLGAALGYRRRKKVA